MQRAEESGYVRWFKDIRLDEVASVGGKNASLGELYSTLSGQGIKVPNGFVLTAPAYRDALTKANLNVRIFPSVIDTLSTRSAEPVQN